jgi:hypothetical protein
MDIDFSDQTIGARSVPTIDGGRRALLGGATSGGIAAAALGTIAMLRSGNAETSGGGGTITGWINVTDPPYNAKGDGNTDDTLALRDAIATGSAAQIPIFMPPGAYKTTGSLAIPSNTMIIGSNPGLGVNTAPGSSCSLQPNGCPAFDIGGSAWTSHCLISDLTIFPQGTTAADHIISIDKSYSITLRNIRIYDTQGSLGAAAILLYGDPSVGGTGHGSSNNIIWDNLIVENDSAQPSAPAVLAQPGCGTHRFIIPDLENYSTLFHWTGGQIDLVLPYMERAGKFAVNCDVNSNDSSAYFNTYGGVISCSQSAECCAFYYPLQGKPINFKSFGTNWTNPNPNGVAVHVYGVPTTPALFQGTVPNVSSSGTSRFTGVAGWQRGILFPDYIYKATGEWNQNIGGPIPALGQAMTTISVPGVIVGSHWARANMNVDLMGVQLSAYVSATNTVKVVAQNNQSSVVNLNGSLYVEAGWM